jgi:hypothetical protein
MKKKLDTVSISEMTTTQILDLPYEYVMDRVRSGEWSIVQFTQWIEDRLNYAFGDGYDEGYDTAEDQMTDQPSLEKESA